MYSNCLFEAIKAKIKNPKYVHIFKVPKLMSKSNHFMWFDGQNYYHSVALHPTKYNDLFHKSKLKKVDEVTFNAFALQYIKNLSNKKIKKIEKKLCLRIRNIPENWINVIIEENYDNRSTLDFSYVDFFEKVIKRPVLFKILINDTLQFINFESLQKLITKGINFSFKVVDPLDPDFKVYKNYNTKKNRISWDTINY